MNKSKIKWIMFDMGNVIVEYKPVGYQLIAEKLNINPEKVKALLINEGMFQKTGRGKIKDIEYLELINREFEGDLTMVELLSFYAKEVETIIDGIEDVLRDLRSRGYKLSLLSNTFFAHWKYIETTEMITLFDIVMASHLLGKRKPNREIYQEALLRMNAKPGEVLFIDDLEENIVSAKGLGIRAFQSLELSDTLRILEQNLIN